MITIYSTINWIVQWYYIFSVIVTHDYFLFNHLLDCAFLFLEGSSTMQ